MVVTTSVHYSDEQERAAREIADQLKREFVPREKTLFDSDTLVLEKDSLVLYSKNKEDKLFFHHW